MLMLVARNNKPASELTSPESGITVEVYTNEPGIQVYAGNFLDGSLTGKKGITYNQRASVCLETQKYPDTPNKPAAAEEVFQHQRLALQVHGTERQTTKYERR